MDRAAARETVPAATVRPAVPRPMRRSPPASIGTRPKVPTAQAAGKFDNIWAAPAPPGRGQQHRGSLLIRNLIIINLRLSTFRSRMKKPRRHRTLCRGRQAEVLDREAQLLHDLGHHLPIKTHQMPRRAARLPEKQHQSNPAASWEHSRAVRLVIGRRKA